MDWKDFALGFGVGVIVCLVLLIAFNIYDDGDF